MKQFFTHTLALLLVLALVATEASAQQFSKRKQYNSVGVSLNAMNYFGDITPKPSIPSFRAGATRPNLGLSITHRFAPRISARAALAYGRITGDDTKAANQNDSDAKYRYNRNFAFRNDIVELSAIGVFDLIENRNTYVKRPDFVPYVFAGVAAFYHNPKGLVKDNATTLNPGDYVELQPLNTEGQTEGYSKTQISIPFGGGVRYKINKDFDIGLEIGWRKTFTDYIDDVSGNFAQDANLRSAAAQYFGRDITLSRTGEFAGFNDPGIMRGKRNEKDWYIVTGITLNYILQPRVKSPKFR
jgi:opacity protein-like surface antigen